MHSTEGNHSIVKIHKYVTCHVQILAKWQFIHFMKNSTTKFGEFVMQK